MTTALALRGGESALFQILIKGYTLLNSFASMGHISMVTGYRSSSIGIPNTAMLSSLFYWRSAVHYDGMLGVCSAQVVGKADVGVFYLMPCPALQLLHDLRALPDARCAKRMAYGQESTVPCYRTLPPISICFELQNAPALALRAETEVFTSMTSEMEKQSWV